MDKRRRVQYRFWLDHNNAEHVELANEIQDMLQRRVFHPFIRDGLRLMLELERGNIKIVQTNAPDAPQIVAPDDQRDAIAS